MNDKKVKVLFLCTGNACRSQMAEGWARHLKGDIIEPYSAGLVAHGLDPRAVKVMQEEGVDISGHTSKFYSDIAEIPFDYIVTVCDHAKQTCPIIPAENTTMVHVGFEDPPFLAKDAKTEEEALDCFRKVRDQIRAFVETLPEGLVRENQ